GTRRAGCGTCRQNPQPTQELITLVTGSRRNGSGLGASVSDGQPDRRMQEGSPVQVSGSTPKRSRTTRSPRSRRLRVSGRTRPPLFSMHSDWAMMTFGPLTAVVSASLSASRIFPTSYVRVIVRTQLTPTPRTAFSIGLLVARMLLLAAEEGTSCPPVAAA